MIFRHRADDDAGRAEGGKFVAFIAQQQREQPLRVPAMVIPPSSYAAKVLKLR